MLCQEQSLNIIMLILALAEPMDLAIDHQKVSDVVVFDWYPYARINESSHHLADGYMTRAVWGMIFRAGMSMMRAYASSRTSTGRTFSSKLSYVFCFLSQQLQKLKLLLSPSLKIQPQVLLLPRQHPLMLGQR